VVGSLMVKAIRILAKHQEFVFAAMPGRCLFIRHASQHMVAMEPMKEASKANPDDNFTFVTGITSIKVNRKNTYELKGQFFDDLHKNAFSGTNGEDAVEHIEYFLKIVDPIDLPNVNQDKLRVVVFLISLVGDAWRWFDGIKGSITRALWDYWKLGSDEIEPTNDETSDLKETEHDDEQEIGEIFKIETNLSIMKQRCAKNSKSSITYSR
nr:hypothetical protein [Tanacetum cinerariifolium]